MRPLTSFIVALPAALLAGLMATGLLASQRRAHAHVISLPEPLLVSKVEGPSNFHRLGLAIESSDMGRTGVWGPSPNAGFPPAIPMYSSEGITGAVTLQGADLYRLNCQPCHKADGKGAPPEINAIIGPVQATSAALMEQRMKEKGRPISGAFARELAAGSTKDLLDRLKNGGQKMPSFGYLTNREIASLVSYLNALAGIPGTAKQSTVTEPVTRVGELLVKGTCHICHDATGRWPDPEELLQGAIPPIGGFTTEKSIREVIEKARHGAPVVMGVLNLPYRGRMPVFDYLSDDEVASAYVYLMIYPPQNPGRIRKPQN